MENAETTVNMNSQRAYRKPFKKSEKCHQLGKWQFCARNKILTGCKQFEEIFGLDTCNSWGLEAIFSRIIMKDRLRFIDQLRKAMESGVISMELILSPAPNSDQFKCVRIMGSLQYSIEDVECRFAGYAEDITAAKYIETAKDDFPAFLNHEIRNPLTTIQLYIQMIEKKARVDRDNDLVSWAGKAHEQVQALEILTATYLDLAVISTGLIPLKKTTFHLSKYLSSYTDDLRFLNPERNFNLDIECNTSVHADRSKIDEVLHNLTGNAIKYSTAGSTITIRCVKESGYYKISVINHGTEIPEDEQSQLFDKYFRTKDSSCGSVKGHGLGLHIVKRIIEQHSGKVGVHCSNGCSVEFFFTIPIQKKING